MGSFSSVWRKRKHRLSTAARLTGSFSSTVTRRSYVNHYYFYIDDENFGPLFIKVCSYAPWSIKLWLNGHQWAKRQLNQRGIQYEALDNGLLL
jgi:hypothetical protein